MRDVEFQAYVDRFNVLSSSFLMTYLIGLLLAMIEGSPLYHGANFQRTYFVSSSNIMNMRNIEPLNHVFINRSDYGDFTHRSRQTVYRTRNP